MIPAGEYTLAFVRSPGPGGQNVNKVATACEIVLEAHRHRSQEANRRDAVGRLERLIEQARQAPKPRKKTKPGRAAKVRRLEGKRQQKEKKKLRGRPALD